MFEEPHPSLVSPNPGGTDDPLGESVLETEAWLRCFEPRDVRLVIGRHQDPQRELHIAQARQDGVPIHRRVAGGGAVVLAPGMLVVALRLRPQTVAPDQLFALVNTALAPAVERVLGRPPVLRGHGDLAVEERKVLGASLRQTSRYALYLGVLLVADAVPLMERYLAMPSREPGYRGGRGHADFCTHLGRWGATVEGLAQAVEDECRGRLRRSSDA